MSPRRGSLRRILTATLFAAPILSSTVVAAPPNRLPSEQEVFTFIADTIDWYRRLPNAQQIGTEPADLLFLEDNRPITAEVARLAFQFGKAVAAIEPAEKASLSASSELQDFIAAKAKLDANAQNTVNELNLLGQTALSSAGTDPQKLDTQMAEIRRRIQVLKAMSTNYEYLLDFVRNASAGPARAAKLAALLENLERTVPELSSAAQSVQTSNIPVDLSSERSGIVGIIFHVSTLSRKEHLIDGVIERTDALSRSLQNMRAPLTEPFRKEFLTLSLDSTNVDVLEQQETHLTSLVADAKVVSPAIAPLMKQQTLLNLYSAHLAGWRSEIRNEYRTAWKTLLVRMGILGAAIAILLGINMLGRRLTRAHVHDFHTREMLLVGERVLLWLLIVVLVLFAFAFDLSSLATFLGLLSAGLAIGLHDVILAIGGYLLITRKFHVRSGDRVQISGVTGEVINLSLMQFELDEIDPATRQRTGRVVFFSNSYVFVSPATPLFKQVATDVSRVRQRVVEVS